MVSTTGGFTINEKENTTLKRKKTKTTKLDKCFQMNNEFMDQCKSKNEIKKSITRRK